MMKERLAQATMNYEQDKYAAELMIKNKRESFAYQREDLYDQKVAAGIGIAAKAVGGALGMAAGFNSKEGAGGALSMIAGGVGVAASMASDISFLVRYPKLMRRIDAQERDLIASNSQQLYQRRQNYEHDFRFQTLKLNKLCGTYQKPTITNRDAQEKYNQERGVDNVSIEILSPSAAQQTQIDHIYNTFGCECISDRFTTEPLVIRDGMEPGLYKFSKIERGGIESPIADTTLRDIFKQILENGAKFEGCEFEVDVWDERDISISLPPVPKIVFDTNNIKDWAIEKWDTYNIDTDKKDVVTEIKKDPHYGLTDDEWNTHKDKFTDDLTDDQLLDLIRKIIAAREEGSTIVVELPPAVIEEHKWNVQIATLNDKIKTLEDNKQQLETQLADTRQQFAVDKQKLENDKQQLETQLTHAREQQQNLEQQKAEKERQIAELQESITNLTADKKNIEDQLAQCGTEKSKLEDEKKQLHTQLTDCQAQHKDLTKQKTDKEGEITIIQGTVNALTLEKLELQNKITELENQIKRLLQAQATCDRINTEKIKQLQAQIKALTDEKSQCQTRLTEVNTQLDTATQKLADNTKLLTELQTTVTNKQVEIDRLKQQIKDKQAIIDSRPTKAELNQIKAQLDAKTKELADKVAELGRVTQRRDSLENQVRTKSAELSAKNSEIRRIMDQLNQKTRELEDKTRDLTSKTKSLTDLQKKCDDEKKKADQLAQQLNTELSTHKQDKEELTQQLNDERRKYLNERDRANKLDADLKTSQQGYNQLLRDYNNTRRELDRCKTDRDTRPKQPERQPTPKDDCALFQRIMKGSEWPAITDRDNG